MRSCSGWSQPPRSWIQPLDGNGAIPITPEGVRATRLSPDGQSIVAMREGKIVVHRVDQSAPRALASAMPQEWPIRWNAAGNAIYLFHELENAKGLMVDQVEVPSGRRTNLRQIGLPEGATEFLDAVAMTARGDACAFSYQSDTTTLYLVDGLR